MKKILIPLAILLLSSLLVLGCGPSPSSSPAATPPPPAKTSAVPAPPATASTAPAAATSAPISSPAATSPLAAKPGTPAPKYGGTLKILAVGSAVNLGVPWQPRAISDVLMRLPCVETLMRVDDLGLPAPSLFTSWQIAPDLKSITLKSDRESNFTMGRI